MHAAKNTRAYREENEIPHYEVSLRMVERMAQKDIEDRDPYFDLHGEEEIHDREALLYLFDCIVQEEQEDQRDTDISSGKADPIAYHTTPSTNPSRGYVSIAAEGPTPTTIIAKGAKRPLAGYYPPESNY